MYKGDTRTRTIDIYVDGSKTDTWTSSGTTTALENVKLGFHFTSSTSSYSCVHPGVAVEETIELRGVLADSEWLSILEVGSAGVRRNHCTVCSGMHDFVHFRHFPCFVCWSWFLCKSLLHTPVSPSTLSPFPPGRACKRGVSSHFYGGEKSAYCSSTVSDVNVFMAS